MIDVVATMAIKAGINVVAHPLAREVRTVWRVERHPTRKRRRGWRVVAHRIDRPGAYLVGGHTLYVHPEILARIRSAL